MLEALGEFADAILEIAQNAMSSPWIYVVILLFAAIDSVLPLVPAETLVITAGVFAASGAPSLWLLILVAATGAYIGDHMAYGIGRYAGRRLYNRSKPGSKMRSGFGWAEQQLQERGGLILVVCRQIPGGRTAVTLTAGTVHYPLRKFSFFEIFAALSWGMYAGLIGYFGGITFGEEPLKGLAVGFSIAIGITAIVELTRFLINRRRRRLNGQTAPEGSSPEAGGEAAGGSASNGADDGTAPGADRPSELVEVPDAPDSGPEGRQP
ncbi:DedA family protein [Phytoactinopolyspora mesophila]|uniref:DedA family protein n=1 Tax=Phytoactinopolyspora mesophila TaxID=2650750 RepID=A0A7K3LZD9_9ACTN|nr:DedA family protein [Phytoactinopolyspora mesophila]NDL56403.1 DedA family protein [Phytoactinopolyspora mesophila]